MKPLIFLALLAGLAAYVTYIYNRLVDLRNRKRNGFSQIDVQLQRRYDLIPNLVESSKAYLRHERETLQAVIAARNTAAAAAQQVKNSPDDAQAMLGLMGAEAALGGVLTRFMALAEAYPELKANETMSQLQEELASTENRVAFARQAYNDAVTSYNTQCEKFPDNLIAAKFNFKPAEQWQLENAESRKAVAVQF